MTDPINIPRAVENGRKVRFSHYKNKRLYYDTAFGEQFFIHRHHVPSSGISREEDALSLQSDMQHFNDYHTGGD